ncbi:hypothetical protein HDU77_011520 [Chytriomyces hyalinus]|nr:hypothetical protein HDU77_011520 [Chytriomyces hyalinus]
MVKSTGYSSSPGPSTKTELTKLPAYADAGDFTSWLRQYLLVAEQKFGSGEELYIPKVKRGTTTLFHPVTSKPVEPETTAQFDARHSALSKDLEDMYQQQHDIVFKLATQAATGNISAQTTADRTVDNQETNNSEPGTVPEVPC